MEEKQKDKSEEESRKEWEQYYSMESRLLRMKRTHPSPILSFPPLLLFIRLSDEQE